VDFQVVFFVLQPTAKSKRLVRLVPFEPLEPNALIKCNQGCPIQLPQRNRTKLKSMWSPFSRWEKDIPEEKDNVHEKRSLTCRKNKGPPRTLRIFREAGEIIIMVLCNQKKAPQNWIWRGQIINMRLDCLQKNYLLVCIEKTV